MSLAIALIGICLILAFGSEEVDSHGGQVTVEVRAHGSASKGNPHTEPRPRPTDSPSGGTDVGNESGVDLTYSNTSSGGPTVPQELWLITAGLFGALVGLLLPTPKRRAGNPNLVAFGLAAVVMALAIFALTGGLDDSVALQGVLAAGGAALVALPIPTPARYDPR